MEAAALPATEGRFSQRLGAPFWALLAAGVAGGAGLLTAAHPRIAFTVALCLFAAAAVHYRPYAALLVLLLVAARRDPLADTVFFIAVVGGGPAIAWRFVRAPAKVFLVPLFAFLLLALAGVRFSQGDSPISSPHDLVVPLLHFRYLTLHTVELQDWLRLAVVPVAALLAATSVRTVRQLHIAIGVTLAAAAITYFDAIKQLATGDLTVREDSLGAVRGGFVFPNELALYLVIVLLLATVAALVVRRPGVRALIILDIGIGAFMLLHTYTRSAWIAFSFALLIVAVMRYRSLLAIALLTLVIAIAGFPSAVHAVQQRFGDLTAQNQANAGNSLTWRRGQWSAMWHWGSDAPLTGQGFGSYRRLTVQQFGLEAKTYSTIGHVGNQTQIGFTAHNDYIKTYVENGVPGLLLWVASLVGVGLTLLRARRRPELAPWAVAMFAALVAIAIMSFSDNVQGYGEPLLYCFSFAAALAALRERPYAT